MSRSLFKFLTRSGRRLGITIVGGAVLLAGLVMLVLPGPGILTVLAGLAILGTEYAWARRALDEAKRRAKLAAARVRRRRGASERGGDPPDAGAGDSPDASAC